MDAIHGGLVPNKQPALLDGLSQSFYSLGARGSTPTKSSHESQVLKVTEALVSGEARHTLVGIRSVEPAASWIAESALGVFVSADAKGSRVAISLGTVDLARSAKNALHYLIDKVSAHAIFALINGEEIFGARE